MVIISLRCSGNFDRYSATRRTRRYKKNQDSAGDKDKSDASSPELIYDEKPQRPNTLALTDEEAHEEEEDAMLRVWQDKLKRRDIASSTISHDIDAALAEITRSGEDLQHLSHSTTITTTTTTTAITTISAHRSSRLPVSQPPPVVAVTNTVLSPVMQESRPREPMMVLAERAVSSRERHRSMIDPSQVKEAVRLTSNPPSQVNQEQESRSLSRNGTLHFDRKHERNNVLNATENGEHASLKSDLKRGLADDLHDRSITRQSSMFRSRFIPDINVTSSSLPSSGKSKDQELNDEGFEETQSLVSETLSQETSSGNYEMDTHDSTRCSPAELGYGAELHRRRSITATMDDDDLDGDRRSSMVKIFGKTKEIASTRNTQEKSSLLPKRMSDTHKRESAARKMESSKRVSNVVRAASNTAMMRNEVQRSGSRSSLRSSRSSLNSATSVNTVRNLTASHAHLRNYTSAICTLTNDLRKNNPSRSPMPSKDSAEKRRPSPRVIGISRIPASRSSSSGSSVAAARNTRKAPAVGSI